MRRLLLLPAYLILSSLASPVTQHVSAVNQDAASELASFTDAFDVFYDITPSSLQCLRDGTYNGPTSDDRILPSAVSNIQLAAAVGLGVEVYMSPLVNSRKTGAQQLEVVYSSLLDSNITVKSIWLQVAEKVGSNWESSSPPNIRFLNSFLQRANIYGLTVGILTSLGNWDVITGNATISNILLWYFISDEYCFPSRSPPDFNDFVPFAGWANPTVKQFDVAQIGCGINVNRDIYSTPSPAVAHVASRGKSDRIVVGGLGLGHTAFAGKAEIRH